MFKAKTLLQRRSKSNSFQKKMCYAGAVVKLADSELYKCNRSISAMLLTTQVKILMFVELVTGLQHMKEVCST